MLISFRILFQSISFFVPVLVLQPSIEKDPLSPIPLSMIRCRIIYREAGD